MGTLAELKTRIASELNRSDLTSTIADQIDRAIDRWSSYRFWFNETTGTTTTSDGVSYVTAPSGLRVIDKLFVTIGTTKYELCPQSFATIQDWLGASTTAEGQPSDYAWQDGRLYLYPTPDATYTLTAVGIFDETAFATENASNAWSTEAEDLITYDVVERIARVKLRNIALADLAKTQRADALAMLRGETARKLSTGVRASF